MNLTKNQSDTSRQELITACRRFLSDLEDGSDDAVESARCLLAQMNEAS